MCSILNDLFYNPDEIHESLLRDSPACARAYHTYDDLENEIKKRLSESDRKLVDRLYQAHLDLLDAVMRDTSINGMRTGARLACDLLFDPVCSD